MQDAPKIGDSLCDACREHFAQVRAYLDAYGVAYTLDPTLVRGLDYYTRTTLEFIGPDESAQASTICGGGRYDCLVEEIGGPPTPGIGFGAGIERLLLSLELEGISADEPKLDVFFAVEQGQSRARRGRRAAPRPASPPTPTTPAARSRASSTYGAEAARRPSSSSRADGMTLRRARRARRAGPRHRRPEGAARA